MRPCQSPLCGPPLGHAATPTECGLHRVQRVFRVLHHHADALAAQVGRHEDGRETYGHSLVVDPWGEVLLDLGDEGAGLGFAEIDQARLGEVRAQLPSLANKRPIVEAGA